MDSGDDRGLDLGYQSLADMYDDIFVRYADRPMLLNFGVSFTYAEIDTLSMNFAKYLQGSLHMQKGERIALVMPNIIQMPIAIIGALRAGLSVVNVNLKRDALSDPGFRRNNCGHSGEFC